LLAPLWPPFCSCFTGNRNILRTWWTVWSRGTYYPSTLSQESVAGWYNRREEWHPIENERRVYSPNLLISNPRFSHSLLYPLGARVLSFIIFIFYLILFHYFLYSHPLYLQYPIPNIYTFPSAAPPLLSGPQILAWPFAANFSFIAPSPPPILLFDQLPFIPTLNSFEVFLLLHRIPPVLVHLNATILLFLSHSFLIYTLSYCTSQPPPAHLRKIARAHKSTPVQRKPLLNTTNHLSYKTNSQSIFKTYFWKHLTTPQHHASPIRSPMRCAPVVSLYPQSPLRNNNNNTTIRPRKSNRKRSPRNLSCSPITSKWLTSPITPSIRKTTTSTKSPPNQPTTSLNTIAQSRAPCFTTSNSPSNHFYNYSTPSSFRARARRK